MTLKIEAIISDETLEKIAIRASEISSENQKKSEADLIVKQETKKYYTISEMSAMTSVSENTIARHIRQGHLKAHKPGKNYLISKENINLYLNSNNE